MCARGASPCCASTRGPASSWRAARRPRAAKGGGARGRLSVAINLDRRPDRLAALGRLDELRGWERLAATDGRELSWRALADDGLVHADAIREAQWAEQHSVPTICRATGSFSPHLTLSAAGCALSHRRAWQRLRQSGREWALVLEDDISAVAPCFADKVDALARALPSTWQVCWLGYHESTGRLLPAAAPPEFCELPPRAAITGLFGYLLRASAAARLLAPGAVFPLRHQVDVAVCGFRFAAAARFALAPRGVLLAAPKSEEGACDTDVQTLGAAGRSAHAALPPTMMRL
jgi:GR25 family glycosyltransferase involved in LPS biosynthesis